MTKFIRCGRDYINMSNILRWEVTQLYNKQWQANMTLKEHKTEGFMLGSAFFGFGSNTGKHQTYYWTFDQEDHAHTFVQRKLKSVLEKDD